MDDDVILNLEGDDPLHLGTVPTDVTFLDLTTTYCRCQVSRGWGAWNEDPYRMKIFGTNGRGLLNSGFIQQNITLAYRDFLPLYFYNTVYRDMAYYKYLFSDGPISHIDGL